MDLDTLKTAWQQQEFDATASSLLRDEVEHARWRLVVSDWTEAISWTLVIALAATVLRDSQSLMARAGMIITIAGAIGHMVLLVVAGIRDRMTRMDFSVQAFVREELRKVDSKIRQRRLRATWYTLPPAAGVILWFASLRPSVLEWIVGGVVAAGLFLYSRWMSERKIRRELTPIREELDRQLRELASDGMSAAVLVRLQGGA
jgi:hypothetical protein